MNLWELWEDIAEEEPSRSNSGDSLFGERIEEDQPELSASFYAEWNPEDQAVPHPYQLFSLNNFQPPSPLELPANPVGPITMTSYMNPAPHNSAHAKEYGLNKPMPFSGNWTKVKAFLQECLVYIDMNKEKYMMVISLPGNDQEYVMWDCQPQYTNSIQN